MGRPRMSEQDRMQACLGTQRLIREVKLLSGWSAEKLSSELNKCSKRLDISGGLIRQYLSGKRSASLRRRRDIALAADELGCCGQECGSTTYWAWATLELGCDLDKVFVDHAQETKRSFKKLEQALGELLDLGFDELDILSSVEMKISTLTRD